MGLKLVKGKVLPIGIDLGTSCLKMAQLRMVGDATELSATGSAEVPHAARGDPAARLECHAAAIRDLMRTSAFQGRECILSLPAEATFVHHLRIPKVAPGRLMQAVLQEVQGKMPFPVGAAEVRPIVAGDVAGETEPKQEIIVVAVSRPTLDSYLAMARRARLDVAGVNIPACAILECFGRLFRRTSDQQRAILFVDLGQASTQVVLSHGNRMVFARNLTCGGDFLDRSLAEGLKISPEQAARIRREVGGGKGGRSEDEVYELLSGALDSLAGELTQCLRYHESVFRSSGVERAIFLGGQANDKRLCQSIAQRLNVPAQIGDPMVRFTRADGAGPDAGLDRREPQPQWAVAIGLSLGAAEAA